MMLESIITDNKGCGPEVSADSNDDSYVIDDAIRDPISC